MASQFIRQKLLFYQSKRRRSLEISPAASQHQQASSQAPANSSQTNDCIPSQDQLNAICYLHQRIAATTATTATSTSTSTTTNGSTTASSHSGNQAQAATDRGNSMHPSGRRRLRRDGGPALGLLVGLVLCCATAGQQLATTTTTTVAAARQLPAANFGPAGTHRTRLGQALGGTIDWRRVGARFTQHFLEPPAALRPIRPAPQQGLHHSNRWTSVPNTPAIRDSYRFRRQGYLARVFNRIRRQIGARNSIRVHNAFRDLAWDLLARLSMPTPVIYDLRRQHLYSPDEDSANDSLYDKNTTRTIRTARRLGAHLRARWAGVAAARALAGTTPNALTSRSGGLGGLGSAADDEDDEEPESLRERLRMRLDDLLSLSRRSLFGRVVRLPAIFPFKRQQQEQELGGDGDGAAGENSSDLEASSSNSDSNKSASPGARSSGRWGLRRRGGNGSGNGGGGGLLLLSSRRRKTRRRREPERQLITINGKQYFVDDDDGELKPYKESGAGAAAGSSSAGR